MFGMDDTISKLLYVSDLDDDGSDYSLIVACRNSVERDVVKDLIESESIDWIENAGLGIINFLDSLRDRGLQITWTDVDSLIKAGV